MVDIDVLIAELQNKCDELDARARNCRARMNEIRSEYQQMLREYQKAHRAAEAEHSAVQSELSSLRKRLEQLIGVKRAISQERNALRAAGEDWLEQARRVVHTWLREGLVDGENAVKLRRLADRAPVEPTTAAALRELALSLEREVQERRLAQWRRNV